MKIDTAQYEEWLTTIANTRLMYNTLKELEDFLDNHSIHNNGIKRCYSSPQKLRATYRDLKIEAERNIDGIEEFEKLLHLYKQAWIFYKEYLSRRNDPTAIALELLKYCYLPINAKVTTKKRAQLFNLIEKENIDVPFIILLLLKAIPGYDSKDGDIDKIHLAYEKVMQLLETFVKEGTLYDIKPSIIKARNEPNKTRLKLWYHTAIILSCFENYQNKNIYDTCTEIKNKLIPLELNGFWNEYDGKLQGTNFWLINQDNDLVQATKIYKDKENNLECIHYPFFTLDTGNNKMTVYVLHPEAMIHRITGKSDSDYDQVWYQSDLPLCYAPDKIELQRIIPSKCWRPSITLTKVTDKKIQQTYENLMNSCKQINKYKSVEYEFIPSIYAITQTDIYIEDVTEKKYYKIPKSSHESFQMIKMDDVVGILIIKNQHYIIFDELSIFIDIKKKSELKRYGITIVDTIE